MVKPIYLKAKTIRDEIEPLSLYSFNILLEGSICQGQERALPFYIVEDSRNGRERNRMKEEDEGEGGGEEERRRRCCCGDDLAMDVDCSDAASTIL